MESVFHFYPSQLRIVALSEHHLVTLPLHTLVNAVKGIEFTFATPTFATKYALNLSFHLIHLLFLFHQKLLSVLSQLDTYLVWHETLLSRQILRVIAVRCVIVIVMVLASAEQLRILRRK